MPTLLFVCTGNTCRSPLAAALTRQRAGSEGLEIDVASAGISAMDGASASGHAQFVAIDRGADLGAHRSRALDERMIEDADLVLAMTAGHRDAIRRRWPRRADRVLTLGEFAGLDRDVADPFGGSLEDYERVAGEITELLDSAWARIARLGKD